MSNEKKFRFQNSAALLTYKRHINKHNYVRWFTKLTNQTPVFIRLAHETGSHEDGGEDYNHTHVVFKVEKRIDTINQRFFDYKDVHPHIKVLKHKKAIDDAKRYIAKEDPENEDLLDDENIVKGIWAKNSVQDALTTYVKKPADAMGIVTLFNMKACNVEINDEDIPNMRWHQELMKEVSEKPTISQRRKVVWYCDPNGGCEKTKFARYQILTNPSMWFVSKDMGTSKDAATVIKNALSAGWTGHGMIIDLPRQARNHKRMYTYIEEIKDGMVTTQKYNGQTCVFNIPHLIIFANWMPLFYMLSKDRWDVRILERDSGTVRCERYKPTKEDFVCPDRDRDTDDD